METGEFVRVTNARRTVGWRAWTVEECRDGVRLGSVIHDAIWTPGASARASCRLDELHVVPDATCNCGFHAARDPVDAFSYLHGRDEPGTLCRVLGEVVLSGLVVETEGGWRASEAYPLRLYAGDTRIAAALAIYDVPVLSPKCESASATISTAASGGSRRSSWSAARTRSSWTAAFG
jgi:hypothetical protein